MKKKVFITVLVLVSICSASSTAFAAPKAFEKCIKCHGKPGGKGTKTAPDLATSKLTFGQFRKQVLNGSKWKGKPPKKMKYKWKKMPAQLNVSEEDIETLFKYVRGQ